MTWVVQREGRGLDFALEIVDAGDRQKDLHRNVARYAALGIPEYFVFDIPNRRLLGWRLAPDERRYEHLVQQHGLFSSTTLGLELGLEGERVRFYSSGAPLPDNDDLIRRLGVAVDEATARAAQEARRAEEEARRAEEEARRAEALAARVAELEAALRAAGETTDS